MYFLLLGMVLGILLLWFLLTPPGPTRERGKPLERVVIQASTLAWMQDGSTLRVTPTGGGAAFSFRKEPDLGGREQTLSLYLRESECPPNAFEAVAAVLQQAPGTSSIRIDGTTPKRLLISTLVGNPSTYEFLIGELMARLCRALALSSDTRFDLVLDGAMNQAIWRRTNAGALKTMASPSKPWLLRKLARYQLRRHKDEN